jgi:hypothetical protein
MLQRLKALTSLLLLLCASLSCAANLWLTDKEHLYRVDSGTGQVMEIERGVRVDALAAMSSAEAWVAAGPALRKLDASGRVVTSIDLARLGLEDARLLAAVPYDHTLWVAWGRQVVHLTDQGAPVATAELASPALALALGQDQSAWIVTESALLRYGAGEGAAHEVAAIALPSARAAGIAIDSARRIAWVAAGAELTRIDFSRPDAETMAQRLPSEVRDLALDVPTGTLFVLSDEALSLHDTDGTRTETLDLAALDVRDPTAMALDHAMGSLWIAHATGIAQLSLDGRLRAVDVLSPPAQKLSVESFWIAPELVTKAAKNKPPTVSMTAPANGATFPGGSNITLAATAADSDGTIAKVAFYRGGSTLIGTATTSPYAVVWSNVPPGNYSLTAVATDNSGASTTSSAISITVTANKPPSVTITSPANNALVAAPANLTIAASAADSDGAVARIDFYDGSTLLGSATGNASTLNASLPYANIGAGTRTLTAVATDNAGAQATSSVVTVIVDMPPRVVLTSPVACTSQQAPATLTLSADAVDFDGWITKVDFYQNGVLVGTAARRPYTFVLSNLSMGSYVFTAVATDNAGMTVRSVAVPFTATAPNIPPTVSLTAPVAGSILPVNVSVPISASAADTDGTVTRIEYSANGNTFDVRTSPPLDKSVWVPGTPGTYNLTAKAYDNSGGQTTSAPVAVTVVADTPPSVRITSPDAAATFYAGSTITITATATDSDGAVAKVDFYAGSTLLGTATQAPYTFNWINVPAGSYLLVARATDNLGATSTSSPVNITVNAHDLPLVSLTAPAAGSAFIAPATVNLAATASASGASIAKVDFYADNALIGTATAAPYTATWMNAPAASYSLVARATDSVGAVGTSSPMAVTVDAPPQVTITAPTAGASYTAPATVNITVQASDSDGVLTKVEVFYDGISLGVATAPPNTHAMTVNATWNFAPAGNHVLTAQATDNAGAVTTSNSVPIAVHGAPTVSLDAPPNGASYAAPATITLAASASEANGSIAKVEFYQGASLIGTATQAPYTVTWSNVTIGNYTLTAVATDGFGTTVTSNAASVSVRNNVPPTVSLVSPTNGAAYIAPATIVLTANASDSDGAIAKVEFYQGTTLLATVTTAPYTYTWTNVPLGNYTITAKAADGQGATSVSAPVSITVGATPSIVLAPGLDGTTIADDNVLVSGSVQAPLNSAVFVNGNRATVDANGNFFSNNVPLAAGSNAITVTLMSADGTTTSQSLTLTSGGPAPFDVSVAQQEGLAPMNTSITVTNRAHVPFQRIEFDLNNDGVADNVITSLPNDTGTLFLTLPSAGIATIKVTVFDSMANVIHTTQRKVNVVDPKDRALLITRIYGDLTSRLSRGDIAGALNTFSQPLQPRFQAFFNRLGPNLGAVVSHLGTVDSVTFGDDFAELVLTQTQVDGRHAYPVQFVRGWDGIWRIDGM